MEKKTKIQDLKKSGIKANRRFGQNFMVEEWPIAKIIEAADISASDLIVEIGPGSGFLTEELAKKSRKVIAIEKDRDLMPFLKEKFSKIPNIELINEDARDFDYTSLPDYKVVSNLPFYITSRLIRLFLELPRRPQFLALMVQKEVGERICALPPKMSLLAVSVQLYARTEFITEVPRTCFQPSPKVDGAIIKIAPHQNTLNKEETDIFFKIAKAGFSQPRKNLLNNFVSQLQYDKKAINDWMSSANITPQQRAQTLSISDWIMLTKNFYLYFPLC